MIGHAILWEIVGADFFRAVSGLDLASPFGGDGFMLLGLLHFVEASAEHTHGLGAILDLRLFILLRDDQALGMCVMRPLGVGRGEISSVTFGQWSIPSTVSI